MKSRWAHVKEEVISLRQEGASMNEIEARFGVPKSTQNSWFWKIELPEEARAILRQKKKGHLIEARKKAVEWHNTEKAKRLEAARISAEKSLSKIDLGGNTALELALAMLYMGEGFKTISTGIGNSDPLILKFFLAAVAKIYGLNTESMRFDLHLRADQKPEDMKAFWSKELGVPLDRFKGIFVDKRTIGRETYPTYKGVCLITCGNVAIQRKLVYLSRAFCNKILGGQDSNMRA
jgi:hypothetical protein